MKKTLEMNVTPEMIIKTPTLLEHSGDFQGRTHASYISVKPVISWFAALTASDGLFGASTSDGKLIITSPNCSTIYEPPLGGDRSLFLRSNLRYGNDDPLQWPQPYVQECRHLACIRWQPVSSLEPTSIMFSLPERTSFILDNDMLHGVGKLAPALLSQLKELTLQIFVRAKKPIFQGMALVSELTNVLKALLHHLEFVSSSFFTMRQHVREHQQVYLELEAFLNFNETYRHEKGTPTVAIHLMGAFTTDPLICQALFEVGLPVWLIQPFSALPSIRIRTMAVLRPAQGFICLDPCTHPTYLSIYRGRSDVVAKYRAINAQILKCLKYPNPFGTSRAITSVAAPPLAELSKLQVRSKKYSPCMSLKSLPWMHYRVIS